MAHLEEGGVGEVERSIITRTPGRVAEHLWSRQKVCEAALARDAELAVFLQDRVNATLTVWLDVDRGANFARAAIR